MWKWCQYRLIEAKKKKKVFPATTTQFFAEEAIFEKLKARQTKNLIIPNSAEELSI